MTTTCKIILTFSAACIALSFTEVGGNFYYGILRPVGAIAFVVFFIVNMLGKEMKKFDEDHPLPTEKKATSLTSARNHTPA
jgi:hypothetical protein